MTLLDFFGLQFEAYHKECTCPSPRVPIVRNIYHGRMKVYSVVTNRCEFCGLTINPRLEVK